MANDTDDAPETESADEDETTSETTTADGTPAEEASEDKPAATKRVNPKLGPALNSPATKAAARKAAAAAAAAKEKDGQSNKGADKAKPRPVAKKNVTKNDPAKVAARSGNPKKKAAAEAEMSRVTTPTHDAFKVSPWYIPALMFGLLGLGMLIIFLNYIQWPFGDPSNWRLLLGLLSILGGILVATRYQ